MTQEEFEKCTPEEWAAEVERCKDHVYFYNTYWLKSDGTKPNSITKGEYDAIFFNANELRFKLRTPRRSYPMTINEAYLPEFTLPKK